MKYLSSCIFLYLMLQINIAAGQYNGNYWCFGDSAFIDWSNPQSPVLGYSSFFFRNGSSSIGDTNGLICYAGDSDNVSPNNGYVWNKYHLPVNGAHHIYGMFWYHANLFIPDPGNDSILYLFTIGVTVGDPIGFYYTTINYKANNDSGVVIQKNVQLNNYPAFDALMGVRHGNGRDWWLIFQRWYTNNSATSDFYLYLISDNGLTGPFIQNMGSDRRCNGGQLIFSTSADKFVQVSIRGMIEIYNFDRCTGLISSSIPIEQEPAIAPYPHWYSSCAFSPDDSKLYVLEYSQTNPPPHYLWQFDLNASNIAASKTAIDSLPGMPYGVGQLKLAPDGKIYMTTFDQTFGWPYPDTSTAFTTINNNLSVINYPDSSGVACNFQPFIFNLGTGRAYFGLPNNPNYELGALTGSPCDTLGVGLGEPGKEDVFFQAWYNREWDLVHVNATGLKGRTGRLRLFDLEGRLVYEKKIEVIPGGYVTTEIGMQGLANGLYMVSLQSEKERMSGKIMKL